MISKERVKILSELYFKFSIRRITEYISMLFLFLLSLYVRLLPLQYGEFIGEFDPYLQFYATKVIVEGIETEGLRGLFSFFNHHIKLTWYPYGVDLGLHYYPGVPYIGALTYIILKYLGIAVSLYDVAVFLPPVLASVSVIFLYLIGKEIKSEFTGIIAAIFYSIAPAVIARSNLGWYDTECVGMPALIIALYFFIKSLKEKYKNKKIIYSILAGVFSGLMGASWGAFAYLYAIYAFFSIVVVLFSLDDDYIYSYLPMILVTMIIVESVPRVKYIYLMGYLALLQYLAIGLVISYTYLDLSRIKESVYYFITISVIIALAVIVILPIVPIGLSGRLLSVANPLLKAKYRIIQTVQEQANASFVFFFRNFFILIPFSIYGLYLMLKDKRVDHILLAIFLITSIYAASNFVRLLILSAPFITLAGALGLEDIFSCIFGRLFAYEERLHRKYGFIPSSIKAAAIVFIIIIVFSSVYYAYGIGIPSADYPVTILTGGAPINQISYCWLEALEWMKVNIPNSSIIAAWWDYGYWISFIAGKKTLADNGTLNTTRIALLARMFLSDEDNALKILKQLHAKYIVIYLGTQKIITIGAQYYILWGFGEDGKFIQMAKIIGEPESKYINRSNTSGCIYKQAFWNTFLGKLIPYTFLQKQRLGNGQIVDIYTYYPKYPEKPNKNTRVIMVYRTESGEYGEVIIYKIVHY